MEYHCSKIVPWGLSLASRNLQAPHPVPLCTCHRKELSQSVHYSRRQRGPDFRCRSTVLGDCEPEGNPCPQHRTSASGVEEKQDSPVLRSDGKAGGGSTSDPVSGENGVSAGTYSAGPPWHERVVHRRKLQTGDKSPECRAWSGHQRKPPESKRKIRLS